jgi:hypothetical protein
MISGELADQAALHGTLNKICNLNLALISVIKVDSGAVEHCVAFTDRDEHVGPSMRRSAAGLFLTFRRCAAWESRAPVAPSADPSDTHLSRRIELLDLSASTLWWSP